MRPPPGPRPHRLCFPPLAASNISSAFGCHLDVVVLAFRTAPRIPAVCGGVSGGCEGGRRAVAAGPEPPDPAAAAVPWPPPPPPLPFPPPRPPRPPLPPRFARPLAPSVATALLTSPASHAHATPFACVPFSAYVPTLCSPPARVAAISPPLRAVPRRTASAATTCACTTTLRIASRCLSPCCRWCISVFPAAGCREALDLGGDVQ